MKRRRINLLSLTLKRFDFETAVKKFRFSLIGLIIILLILIGLSVILNTYLDRELAAVAKNKLPLTQYFAANVTFDKQIKYFVYKYALLKDYLKDDAKAYSQFEKLQQHIASASSNAKLLSFQIDNTGQTQFSVQFENFETAEEFLNAVETPKFIVPFEYLKLSSFSVSKDDSESFELTLEGKLLKE